MRDTRLRVFYGIGKLNKIQKKAEISIIFENCYAYEKNDRSISRWMHVVHTRIQNEGEAGDAEGKTRMFTKYNYFVDDKPWNGDIEKVLEQNFQADANNVSKEEREEIREKLRKAFYSIYNRKPIKNPQLKLDL